jgi:hypothetical protein
VIRQKSLSYEFIIERWADGLKVLGAGNGAGVLASAASLQFIATNRPDVLGSVKWGVGCFLAGLFCFSMAFLFLTIFPIAIDRFLTSSTRKYKTLMDAIKALTKANKSERNAYLGLVIFSLLSFVFFIAGLLEVEDLLMRF